MHATLARADPQLCALVCVSISKLIPPGSGIPLNTTPNMLVFDLFTQALGVEIDGVQKDDLFIRNKRAFTDAIKQARGQKA